MQRITEGILFIVGCRAIQKETPDAVYLLRHQPQRLRRHHLKVLAEIQQGLWFDKSRVGKDCNWLMSVLRSIPPLNTFYLVGGHRYLRGDLTLMLVAHPSLINERIANGFGNCRNLDCLIYSNRRPAVEQCPRTLPVFRGETQSGVDS